MNAQQARTIGRIGAQANKNGAEVKRLLRAGQLPLALALQDTRAASVPVFDICMALPRWGRKRVPSLLSRADLSGNPRVRDLTPRQCDNLTRALANRDFYAPRRW